MKEAKIFSTIFQSSFPDTHSLPLCFFLHVYIHSIHFIFIKATTCDKSEKVPLIINKEENNSL